MGRMIKWWLFLALAFYLVAMLTIVPIPDAWKWYRPQWLLMLVIFCQLSHPKLFGVWSAWFIGVLTDALIGTPLGLHGLVFSVVCYFTALARYKFLHRPIAWQLGKIFLLVILGQGLAWWFHVLQGQSAKNLYYWLSTPASCLAWPLMVGMLSMLSRLLGLVLYPSRSM